MASIPDELKQVIIIRKDIKMEVGKTVAQGSHASLMSYLETEKKDKKIAKEWIDTGEKKIVLKVDNEESLRKLAEAFKYKKIPCALVTDAGLTQLPPGTVTALGVGPWSSKELNPITSMLKLL
jgi:PTH2 family peptidyl-tRNA hydrolase